MSETYTIYKIICKDLSIEDCYVGSTKNLRNRTSEHKSNCYNSNSDRHNYKVYKFIRDNGGWENFSVIKIKEMDCSKEEKLLEERKYIELMGTLNTQLPSRTTKQYQIDNKERLKKYSIQYKLDNKAKIKKKYNCECGGKYTYSGKGRHYKTFKHQLYEDV